MIVWNQNYELDKPLPKGKNLKKVTVLMKDEMRWKIISESALMRQKTYSY